MEGAGSAPGSDPLGPVQSILILDTLYPPIPQGRSVLGTSPACCPLRGRAPHLPLAPPSPLPPRAPRRRRGRVAEREEGLEEGGSGSGPTCISVPAVSSGGGGSSRSLPPLPPLLSPSLVLRRRPYPSFPSPKETTIEKSGERDGHLHTHFRHPPTPCNPGDLGGCDSWKAR